MELRGTRRRQTRGTRDDKREYRATTATTDDSTSIKSTQRRHEFDVPGLAQAEAEDLLLALRTCAAGIASGSEKSRRISDEVGFERVMLVRSVEVGEGEVERSEVNDKRQNAEGRHACRPRALGTLGRA